MFFNIYSAVLLTLMFIMSLTSFSIMICSIKNYLKNKTKKELQEQLNKLKANIDYYTNLLSGEPNPDKIKEYTDKILDLKSQLSKLEPKK